MPCGKGGVRILRNTRWLARLERLGLKPDKTTHGRQSRFLPTADTGGLWLRSLRDGAPDPAQQRHGNQYGFAHCLLLPREDVAEGATERIEPDNRKGQPKDCSPVLKIADDAFPRCVL